MLPPEWHGWILKPEAISVALRVALLSGSPGVLLGTPVALGGASLECAHEFLRQVSDHQLRHGLQRLYLRVPRTRRATHAGASD